ncbi:hypothetical protein G7054_g6089 [Neopestalotiopsis clavispora]|nr:hypothetical protein G7054_g6089 [Neopestalotiopsis clavispora]
MDPEHQQLEGRSLAPSAMSRQPSQGCSTVYFGPGLNGTAQSLCHIQQKSADELGYPSPKGPASASPYPTADCSTALAGYQNFMYNNDCFPQPFVNMPIGPEHCQSLSQAELFQQCQQPLQQPGHEENMLAYSNYMGSHAFADGYPEFQSQESLTTGHPYSAVEVQASLQSPVSQPSQSPSTLGPLTPQCPRLSPLPSPQLSTPSDFHLFTDTETLPTLPAHDAARFTCRKCGIVKKDSKSLQRHDMEKHCKPRPGETKEGWFRCACGAFACHYRKTNHTRHLNNCKPHKWQLREFVCQCLARHSDKENHIAHYMKCSAGKNPVGRPRGA